MAPLWRKPKPPFEVTIDPVWDPIFCLHGKAGFFRMIFMLMWSIRRLVAPIVKVLFSKKDVANRCILSNFLFCRNLWRKRRKQRMRLMPAFFNGENHSLSARKHPSLMPAGL